MGFVEISQSFDKIPFFDRMNYAYRLRSYPTDDTDSAFDKEKPIDSQHFSPTTSVSDIIYPNLIFSDYKVLVSAFSLDKNIKDGFSYTPTGIHLFFSNRTSVAITFSLQILFLKIPNGNDIALSPSQRKPSIVLKDFRNDVTLAKMTSTSAGQLNVDIMFPEDFYSGDSKYLLFITSKQKVNQAAYPYVILNIIHS